MMKRLPIALLSMILATAIVAAQSDERKRITEATAVMSEMMNAGDKAVPKSILENAVGIAVFPGLFKAGFVVGGQHGNGIVSVYVRPSVSLCRSTHSDVSAVARANGSSPPYISTANAASSSTPTGSQTRYGDSQIGRRQAHIENPHTFAFRGRRKLRVVPQHP